MPNNISTAVSFAKQAAKLWDFAGIKRRLQVLQEIGSYLADEKKNVCNLLLEEGFSQALAEDYFQWIAYAANPNLLENYSRDLVKFVKTSNGKEIFVHRADGVVIIYAQAGSPTFNAGPIFSTLLPGNSVILVRSPMMDKGLRFIVEQVIHPILEKNGFPKHLVTLVTEEYRDALAELISHPDVSDILGIGSNLDNANIQRQAHENNKKVILEHYGRGYLVVWKDAQISSAVKSALRVLDLSGRPCFLPKQFLIHQEVFDKFVGEFLQAIAMHARTIAADKVNGVLSPIMQINSYLEAVNELRQVGQIRCGGYQMDAEGIPDPSGLYASPTVAILEADVCLSRSIQCVDQEILFPLIPLIRFNGDEKDIITKMVKLIQKPPVGLRTSIWTSDLNVIEHFTREIGAISMLRFNSDHSNSPFYASFWGGGNGDNHLFWKKTTHLQAIDCNYLSDEQINSVLKGLGYTLLA